MPRTRHHKPLLLTDDERRVLAQWARRPTTAQRVARRSQIVLACAEGRTNRAVAAQLGVSSNCVCTWRERFRVRRLAGLNDEPRPGVPRTVTDDRVVEVITRTLEAPPPTRTEWSTRSLGDALGLSKATIARIWRTFGLQAHRVETFKLSADPQFVEKVRDIVGLYLNPPNHAIVLSVKVRCKRSIAPARCCPCALASRRGRRTTTFGMARPRCLPPWTWPPGRWSGSVIGAIAIRGF